MAKRETTISLPELGLIAGTRGMIGAGLGLLLADRLNPDQRKAVGWTLFTIGAISSIPLGFEVFGGKRVNESVETKEMPSSSAA
jgi:hypothetical protein